MELTTDLLSRGRTVGSHLVEPGAVLADRYVVEDLLAEEGASNSWRARDKILARSVVLQILPSSAPHAAGMVRAAKHASRVADPRLLQVLDAVDDGELSYVVREWATGQSLNVMLAEGPLSARRAAWLVNEVAGAMCTAHLNDVPHRRLAPDTVVVTTSSGVKVVGLGTFAALRDEPEDEIPGELHDTRDLGRLLYSCLTARWPGSSIAGLPAAPTEHGRLLRPRQVRAGVPRSLDAVCDRILSDSSRYGAPITTVAEVRDELTQILSAEGFPTGVGAITATEASDPVAQRPMDRPPALLTRDAGPPSGEQPRYMPPTSERRRASPLRRSLMLGVVTVLIAGIVLLAYRVGQRDLNEPGASANVPTSTQATRDEAKPLIVESAVSFDPPPQGSGDEQPDLVPFATDGDADTSWETVTYDDQLGPNLPALKEGVGLVLDLGRVQAVREVQLTMPAPGADLEIRTAPIGATSAPQSSVDQYPLQKRVADAQQEGRVVLEGPVRTRFVLVWLTKLPPEATGGFQGAISEVQVLG